MTPAARVQAAIDVLDLIVAAARAGGAPADRIIADWFRTRRFAGSSDRRAVRELAYRAIRACGEVPQTGRAAMLQVARTDPVVADLFDDSRHAPARIDPAEPVAQAGIAPAWLASQLASSGIDEEGAAALLERAPLDIRVNRLKAPRESLVLPVAAESLASAEGLRLPHGTQIEQWDAYRDGLIEVQDAGSQLACGAVAAQPGETVVDLCAGAGGKTLALAAAMDNRGRLIASDIDRARLANLGPRAARAGATLIEELLLDPGREAEALADLAGLADAVLVDAPCSGTGTWRRNPEARWRLTSGQLARYQSEQQRLLGLSASLCKPGGRIVYVTCSLLDGEGPEQVDRFLGAHPAWRADPLDLRQGYRCGAGIRLTPKRDRTDGFFIARLKLAC